MDQFMKCASCGDSCKGQNTIDGLARCTECYKELKFGEISNPRCIKTGRRDRATGADIRYHGEGNKS